LISNNPRRNQQHGSFKPSGFQPLPDGPEIYPTSDDWPNSHGGGLFDRTTPVPLSTWQEAATTTPKPDPDALEFLACVLAHIPDPKRHLVHYYAPVRTSCGASRTPAPRRRRRPPRCRSPMRVAPSSPSPGLIHRILDHLPTAPKRAERRHPHSPSTQGCPPFGPLRPAVAAQARDLQIKMPDGSQPPDSLKGEIQGCQNQCVFSCYPYSRRAFQRCLLAQAKRINLPTRK